MYNIYTMSEVLSSPDDNFDEIVSEITPSWEKEDAIPVPPQCEFCPRVMAALLELDEYKEAVGELLRMASAEEEEIVVVDVLTGERVSEGVIDYACKIAGGKLGGLSEKIAETQRHISTITKECRGPLALRASDGYRFVNVAMCDSPEVFYPSLGEAQIGEPVIIHRDLERDKD